jgi:hypothetical protein
VVSILIIIGNVARMPVVKMLNDKSLSGYCDGRAVIPLDAKYLDNNLHSVVSRYSCMKPAVCIEECFWNVELSNLWVFNEDPEAGVDGFRNNGGVMNVIIRKDIDVGLNLDVGGG